MSRALAAETERLGWLSVTNSFSWVPRASCRSFQMLREQVLEELAACRRSKWQISLSALGKSQAAVLPRCLGRPLARLLSRLGGEEEGGEPRDEENSLACGGPLEL